MSDQDVPYIGYRKVSLTPAQPTVSLKGPGGLGGTLRVNLHWDPVKATPPAPRGSGRGFLSIRRVEAAPVTHARTVDLDLGCLYELGSGHRGVVQALGGRLGAFDRPPYVRLDHDDRSGTASGENLFVNLDHAAQFRRLLIFAFIYSGATFAQAGAVVTLIPTNGTPIEIRLDEKGATARACAVALLTQKDGELVVRREVRYVSGYQSEIDRIYRWGLNWGEGTKPGH